MRLQHFALLMHSALAMGAIASSQVTPCAAWTVEENQARSAFASAVAAAGDVNGDGYGDVLVGAPFFEHGEQQEGRAILYLGSAAGLAATPAWSVESDRSNAFLGNSVASAGDVNGDGFADVIMGAGGFENGEIGEGAAHVYHGSPIGLPLSPSWTVESNTERAFFGQSVASAGDVNGDGYDDVIISAYAFNDDQQREGRVFVYLGSATGLAPTPAWFVDGNQTDSLFGNSVASAGDVNGDGFGDVIIGAPYISSPEVFEGRATLYLGSPSGLSPSHDWKGEGNHPSTLFGMSVASAGDVNGDGFGDVIVGAQAFEDAPQEGGEGGAFVYLGSPSGLGANPVWHTEGDQGNAALGNSVASAGDVNGDGYGDVIVGAFQFEQHGMARQGRALVFLGGAAGLAAEPAWKADSNQIEAWFGGAVSGAGDVNGDGYDEVIVGAPNFDGGETDEGRASVYAGSAAGLARSFVHAGEGINADAVVALDVVLGSTWNVPLHIGHGHGRQGTVLLNVRTSIANGANFSSPAGGRLTEFLISGPLIATIGGTHSGFVGNIPPQSIPSNPALLGLRWAAQYTVVGGGHTDLSQAVHGVVISCP